MQWLAGDASHGSLREDRADEVQGPRQRNVLFGSDTEDERSRIARGREPVQRRRQRSLGPELALETRVVEHHDPALGVGREARAAEQMVETDDDRCQALVSREPIDAVAVLLSEEEISRPRIDGEAAQGGLARSLREGNDDSQIGRASCREGGQSWGWS